MVKNLPSLQSLSLKSWGSGSGLLKAIAGMMVNFTPETDPSALLETLSLTDSLDGLLMGGEPELSEELVGMVVNSMHASASLETLSLNGSLDGLLLGGESELSEELAGTEVDSTHASPTLESLSLTDFQDPGLLMYLVLKPSQRKSHTSIRAVL